MSLPQQAYDPTMFFMLLVLPLGFSAQQEPVSNAAGAVSPTPTAICVVNADGSGRVQITDGRHGDEEPTWSPDGKRIIFDSDRTGHREIYEMATDGSNVRRVTQNNGKDDHAVYSRDGKRIAFQSERDGNTEVYVMNADGRGQVNLSQHPQRDGWPSWSPDGKRIVFSSTRDGHREIYVMDVDGSRQVRITNTEFASTDPKWSPDGTRIVFQRTRERNADVYMVKPDGSDTMRLTSDPGFDDRPSWSSDSNQIVFGSNRDKSMQLYVMNIDGSGLRQLTRPPGGAARPSSSPDGRRIVFECRPAVTVVPVAAQVDQTLAQQYFKEANALCERDDGRMWGVSLCGPMVIADAATGTIATSQPAPAGDRPRVLGLVNAPVQWGGTTWSAYSWQMIPKDDRGARGRLFMHELFHRVQPGLGLTAGGPGVPDTASHLDSLEGRYWMRLEWRALARALGASGAARTAAIADALAFRAARHQRFRDAAASEHAVDINEGIATYTQYVLGSDSAEDAIRAAMATLKGSETSTSFVKTFAYASGGAYGLLLDALSPGWHRKITAASDVGQLLSAAAGVTAAPDTVAAAATRYDGASLRAAEEERDREQQVIIAGLRRRFVDGPVLVVPRAGRGSVNNMGAVVIPEVGTVLREMANTGAWGSFDAKNGALVAADGQTISLPAPVVVDATTLKGDGWTATVGPGWVVQPGPRPGSFRVVKQ